MKKLFLIALFGLSTLLANEKIIVGASPVPHVEILKFIKPILKKEGYDLEIKEIVDYVTPNTLTDENELDANFYQHIPYLNEFNKNNKTKLIPTVGVHLEPLGAYSFKIKNIKELKNKSKIAIPNDPTNESRALDILQEAGLIKIKNKPLKTIQDIISNPKNLKIIEIDAPQLPRVLDDVDVSIINTNFALEADLNPKKDAILLESTKNNPYANYIVIKKGNENNKKIIALNKAITNEKTRDFINKKFQGAIIPAF